MIETLIEAIRTSERVWLCGNGGSAANAMHIANDLVSAGVPAQTLTADIATLTAIANDHGYEQVFSRQLRVLASPRDLLIALSGSGRSPNIIRVLKTAHARNIKTVSIVGAWHAQQTLADSLSNICIRRGLNMQAAEEEQIKIGHDLYREFSKPKGK